VTKARDLPSKAAQSSPKTTKKATPLFSSSTDDDTNDLFKVTKKIDTNNKPKTSLFDDSSSPDDLFQPVVEKKQTPVVKTVETTKKPVSLFDDSSSPDDLFQPTLVKTTDTKIKPGSLFDDSSSPEELFKASKKTLDETKQNDDDSTQVKAVRPSAGKNMLFSPDALAASGLFKKLADKKDGNEIEEENKQANTKDSVKVDTEGKIAAESKKSTIFDSDEDLFNFKPGQIKPKPSIFDDPSDDLFKVTTEKVAKKEPEPSKKKPSIFDDPSDDLFKVTTEKVTKKEQEPEPSNRNQNLARKSLLFSMIHQMICLKLQLRR